MFSLLQYAAVTTKHVIKFNGQNVRYLNELEYIHGEIWANVWQVWFLYLYYFIFGVHIGWTLCFIVWNLVESGFITGCPPSGIHVILCPLMAV